MKFTFLIVSIFFGSFSYAISEIGYMEKWENEVFPFFLKQTQLDYMMSHDNRLRLEYGVLINETAQAKHEVVVLLPGRNEPIFKYSELAYDLYQRGYDVAMLGHRGQGGSERLLPNPEKGHVKRFKYYAKDFEKFMDTIVAKLGARKTYLMAHSMGAAAALMVMAERSDLFDKAVVSSPMLEPDTGKYRPLIALAYASSLRVIGKGEDWAPGEKGYERSVFEGNEVTGSKARFTMKQYLFDHYPEFHLGGVTVSWIGSALGTNNHFAFKYRKIKTPLILLQAGDDTVVFTRRQNKLCKKAKSCTLVTYPTAKHEILMEVDSIRDDALKRSLHFFAQ